MTSLRRTTPILLLPAVAAFLLAQSGNKPVPRAPARAATLIANMNVHASTHMSDDKEHCFKQDNKRGLFFDIATDITSGKAHLDLYDLEDLGHQPPVVDQDDETITNGLVTLKIKGHAVPTPNASNKTETEHLGPGPYLAIVSATGSLGAKSSSTATGISRYFYETFQNDSNECSH